MSFLDPPMEAHSMIVRKRGLVDAYKKQIENANKRIEILQSLIDVLEMEIQQDLFSK